jgi:hypothetical protein
MTHVTEYAERVLCCSKETQNWRKVSYSLGLGVKPRTAGKVMVVKIDSLQTLHNDPSKLIQAVMLLTCVKEVPGSKLHALHQIYLQQWTISNLIVK